MDWRAKVELFEQIRREYEFGIGTIAGVSRKLSVHRRMVREAIGSAIPKPRKKPERPRWKLSAAVEFIESGAGEHQAREVAHRLGAGSGEEVGHQLLFIEQHIAELLAGGLVRRGLDPFDHGEKQRGSLERVEPWIRPAGSG